VPNDPYPDSSTKWKIDSGQARLDEACYDDVADAIPDSGLLLEVVRTIRSGKEAELLLCRDSNAPTAGKVYRFSRTSHRGGRPMKMDSVGRLASREFELVGSAHARGAAVPGPVRRAEHRFAMEFVGTDEEPAPRLQDARLSDPQGTRTEIPEGIDRIAGAGVVHTDLSPFNILLHDDRPGFIDFARAPRADRLGASPWIQLTEASDSLRRSTDALERCFRRHRVGFDGSGLCRPILERLDRFGVFG
jgi:serine/threonine-protein kinase RIO1